jgi:hypothetical protein
MAALTRVGTPSTATLNPSPSQQHTLPASTDLSAGDMVYIKSDGTFAKADGTAADAKALPFGMAVRSAKSGQPVTARHGCQFRYGSGLTPGARYYVDTTAGGLNTAATTGGTVPVAFAVDAENIFVLAPTR